MSHFTIIIFLFTVCIKSYAASYLDIGSFQNDMSIYTLDDEDEIQKQDVNTNFIGISFGHFLSNATAFELGYIDGKVDDITKETSSGSYNLESEVGILFFGFRWFAFESINFRSGIAKFDINPGYTSNGISDTPTELSSRDSENTAYFGAGLGLTFNNFQFYYDFTTFPLKNRDDLHVNLMGLRFFIK